MNPKFKYLKFASVLIAAAVSQVLLGYESGFAHMAIVGFVGTVSLKDLREKVKGARKALIDARKAKKDASEIAEHEVETNRLQKFVDDAEAEDQKDEAQIEVKAQGRSEGHRGSNPQDH